ncbi:MAG: hypothetical protein JSW22_00805 [Chloroflexota bacterium]|nr:MAG: hypothetical protein JSW22_00805 [Chloroflexota bacterium]
MMSQDHCTTCSMGVGDQIGICRQASEGKVHGSSSGRLSWYFAERPITGLPYVLTTNGYIILPSGNTELAGGEDNA